MRTEPVAAIGGRVIRGEGVVRVSLEPGETLPTDRIGDTGLFHRCDLQVLSPIDLTREGEFGVCRFCRTRFGLGAPART
ncbi:MAG: hypothetical protein ACREJI_10145 [Candidatus Methylomirabilales bacterium]